MHRGETIGWGGIIFLSLPKGEKVLQLAMGEETCARWQNSLNSVECRKIRCIFQKIFEKGERKNATSNMEKRR